MPQVQPYTETPRYPESALSFADLRAFDSEARLTSGESRFCCPLPACAGKEIKKENRCFTLNGRTGVYKCHRCGGAGKVTDRWEDRAPMTRQGRSQAALRRFGAPPAPLKEYSPKPAEEWQHCLRGLRLIAGSGGAVYLQSRGIPEPIATAAGVKFSASWPGLDTPCVVFPVYDASGLQVAAQARSIKDSEKRTAGSVSCGLFTPFGAIEGDCIILTEAPIDALSLGAAGIAAAALCGLALREWLLPALAWKTLLIATDADEAGEKAYADWQTACAPFGVRVLRVRPEGGKDWNAVLTSGGAEAIRALFAAQVPAGIALPAFRSALEIEAISAQGNAEKERREFLEWLQQFSQCPDNPLAILAAASIAEELSAAPYNDSTSAERWEGQNFAQSVYHALKDFWRTENDETFLHAMRFAAIWHKMAK